MKKWSVKIVGIPEVGVQSCLLGMSQAGARTAADADLD